MIAAGFAGSWYGRLPIAPHAASLQFIKTAPYLPDSTHHNIFTLGAVPVGSWMYFVVEIEAVAGWEEYQAALDCGATASAGYLRCAGGVVAVGCGVDA